MSARARQGRKRSAVVPILLVVGVALLLWAIVGNRKPPLEYEAEISRYSEEYAIDPYLVAAVIDTESGFDPEAVSRVGAMGLMQLMPDTAQWISEKIGPEDFDPQMLFQPDTNIRYGCWYLRFLMDRFSSEDAVAAAYNAGHGRVQDWLEDRSITDGEGNLVNIPYEETSNYVRKIAKAKAEYQKDYPDAFTQSA